MEGCQGSVRGGLKTSAVALDTMAEGSPTKSISTGMALDDTEAAGVGNSSRVDKQSYDPFLDQYVASVEATSRNETARALR
jgi:hypothetical protein